MMNLLRGIPKEIVDVRRNYEELVFKSSILKSDLDTAKSLGKIPVVFYEEAQKKLVDANTILDNMKRNIDQVGKDKNKNRLVADRMVAADKQIKDLENSVQRYINSIGMVKATRERLASLKKYWESSQSDTLASIQNFERLRDSFEREMKSIEKEIEDGAPTPDRLLPLVTTLEAHRKILEDKDGLKAQLTNLRLTQSTYAQAIGYSDLIDLRLDTMLKRFESEGNQYFIELESGETMKDIMDAAVKIGEVDTKVVEDMKRMAKVLGPKIEMATQKVTNERAEKYITEYIAKEKSKWIESGWTEEKVNGESKKLEEQLRKDWQQYLRPA